MYKFLYRFNFETRRWPPVRACRRNSAPTREGERAKGHGGLRGFDSHGAHKRFFNQYVSPVGERQ